MELNSRKKSKRDRMMRSKSFETQEMREMSRKEAGKLRGIPILRMFTGGRKKKQRPGKIADVK